MREGLQTEPALCLLVVYRCIGVFIVCMQLMAAVVVFHARSLPLNHEVV